MGRPAGPRRHHAHDFLNTLIGLDFASSHHSALNDELAAAAQLTGAARVAAYGQLEHDLMVAAPIIVLKNPVARELLSRRVGCPVFNIAAMDLAALCPR